MLTEDQLETEFAKKEWRSIRHRMFVSGIIVTAIGYVAITWWLNSIRASASLFWVWVLIIIQFALYFWIFVVSYQRAHELKIKWLPFIVFIVLAVLGRVNNWELVVIPLTVVGMLILSGKSVKSIS